MKLKLLPDGTLDQNLGVTHTLHHWCNPRELWEDLLLPPDPLISVPAEHWPRQLWEKNADSPVPSTVPGWLRSAYHQGYGAAVQTLVVSQALPSPPSWIRHKKGYWLGHVGAGVLVGVEIKAGEPSLYTAYRAADFKLTDYRCPPQNPESVLLRRRIAAHQASQRLARHAEEKAHE